MSSLKLTTKDKHLSSGSIDNSTTQISASEHTERRVLRGNFIIDVVCAV
jgi:hypothetical protein